VIRQSGLDPKDMELVIVDNDQQPSARQGVLGLAASAPFAVVYVHEPAPGVANARNAAIKASRGELIAFLDDDEEAPDGWLAALLAAREQFEADVVFGPVRARAPAGLQRHRAYLEAFFSREGPAQAQVLDGYYGCGNSLLKRSILPHPTHPFALERNHIGGEDDMLFGILRQGGARFAWCPKAWVWEDPAPERLTLAYTLRRAFAYGQGPSAHCAAATPPDRAGIARWMVIGTAQACAFGLLAAVQWLLRQPAWLPTLDRAARGLGKVLWWGPFKIEFYGLPAAS
jgi:hypothetical protein